VDLSCSEDFALFKKKDLKAFYHMMNCSYSKLKKKEENSLFFSKNFWKKKSKKKRSKFSHDRFFEKESEVFSFRKVSF